MGWFCKRKITDHSRRNSTTEATGGRSRGSCCQQLTVMFHTGPTKPSSSVPCGKQGRSPFIIIIITKGTVTSLSGCFPVKAYNRTKTSGKTVVRHEWTRGETRGPTSITTMPNENMSASREIFKVLLRISGAVHLAVYPCAWVGLE